MSTPAGWYPDPRSSDHLRYWSGAFWTEHRTSTPATPPETEASAEPALEGALSAPPHSALAGEQTLEEQGRTANWRTYALVGVLAATAGGLGVALATHAAPRMAAGMASAMMAGMAARMRAGGCEPPEI
jgi:hypothetical protein